MEHQARVTTKEQITAPRQICRLMGVQPGGSLLFEDGVRVRPLRIGGRFAKYRGIGNPGIGSGRKAVLHWMRRLRGQ
jgi:hypothetical protein